MRFWVLGLLGMVLALAAQAETRLALVIHQQNYSGGLSNVGLAQAEADEIATALEIIGFEVTRAADLDKASLDDALDDFRVRLELAGSEAVGFIYYTGHGAQSPRNQNSYLLGVNTKLRASSDFARYGVNLATQRDAFGATGAKAVFLVFDACRNTPAIPGFKADMKGLKPVEASVDMLISYSTSLDDLAEEGIYAPILAQEILRQGQSAELAFLNAQKRVAQLSGGRQRPWSNFQFYKDVYFSGKPSAPVQIDQDLADWTRFEPLGLAGAETYLRLNENGRFVAEANAILAAGKPEQAASDEAIETPDLGGERVRKTGTISVVREGMSDRVRSYAEACERGNLNDCSNLGILYANGQEIARDYSRSVWLQDYACQGGLARGCSSLGRLYYRGNGVEQDYDVALRYYRMACAENLDEGCTNLGDMYYRGLGVPMDQVEGLNLMRRGCENQHHWSCKMLIERDTPAGLELVSEFCSETGRGWPCDLVQQYQN
ncbi:MAG: caspase family protein [Henriciella sp.]